MDRINGSGTIDIGGGRRGFRDENEVAGLEGTEVTAGWLNAVQEELASVILDAGLVLNPASQTQLLEAIRRIIQTGYATDIPVLGWRTAPPASPAGGDRYIVAAPAAGAWAGQAHKIAIWRGAAWVFVEPFTGQIANYWAGRLIALRFDGASWGEWLAGETAPGPISLEAVRAAAPGRLIATRSYEGAPPPYDPTPGTVFVEVGCQAGGGAGGGAVATGPGQIAAGSGGGGGGFVRSNLIGVSAARGAPMTIGRGGASSVAGNGGNGGSSSFGNFVSATGGQGGIVGQPRAIADRVGALGAAGGGRGLGGLFEIAGNPGLFAVYGLNPASGPGGSSAMGAGGPQTTGTSAGTPAPAGGGGGGGASLTESSNTNAAGGDGGGGRIVVWEYA